MRIFEANTPTEMADKVYSALKADGEMANSRNGRVLRFPEPITTVYNHPASRMNFIEGRDANPFFHIAEACWMLAGRKDVGYIAQFNKGMRNYSDNGIEFNAAYGHRMRRHSGFDQLKSVTHILSVDPDSRQAVIQLWDNKDLITHTLDKACNMLLVFSLDNSYYLDLTVYNRSNDLIYGGVTGSNPVHFSYIQQWVADQLGRRMGTLTFVSTNAHVYLDLYPHWKNMNWRNWELTNHEYHNMGPLHEIEALCRDTYSRATTKTYQSNFIEKVAKPVINTWIARRKGESYDCWLSEIDCPATYRACSEWILRREE